MRSKLVVCILVVFFVLVAACQLMADDWMCNSRIINTGDRIYDVLRKCGEPSHVIKWDELRSKKEPGYFQLEPEKRIQIGPIYTQELITIEEWEYNPGPNQFIHYLRFENGRLISITTGDYGY